MKQKGEHRVEYQLALQHNNNSWSGSGPEGKQDRRENGGTLGMVP